MRINLTKKDLVNQVYMQLGFSNSLDVCNRIIKGNLIDKIKDNIK